MTIQCPACEGQIEVGSNMLGEGLACPHCEHPFQLTKEGQVIEYVAAAADDGKRNKIIIGVASVIGIAAIIGFVFLLNSGSEPGPVVASKPAAPFPIPNTNQDSEESAAEPDLAPPSDTAPPAPMPAEAGEALPAMPVVEIPSTPDGVIVAVSQSLADGNPRGIWDALPATYQADVNGLISEYAEVTDPVTWDKGFNLAARLAGVLRDKKDFIFNSPMMAANPQKEEALENWDAVVGLLNTILESDIAQRDKLMDLDVGQFLGTTGAKLFADIESLAKLAPTNSWADGVAKLRGVTAKVLNTTDRVAEVEVVTPGETNKVEKFVQIEERWVPQGMALDWENMLTSARTNLAAMKGQKQQAGMQAMMMMAMVEGVLTQFENAQSQQEFDMAAQGVFGMMMGGMGGAGGPGMPGQGMPPGFPPPGMDSPPGMNPPPPGQPGFPPPGAPPKK